MFVGVFEMCHRLDLTPRLGLEPRDADRVADLLMTKLQVVELNQKDVDDAALLLSEHELGDGPGDHIDVAYLSALVGDDWGLWRTSTGTLEVVAELRARRRRRARANAERLRGARPRASGSEMRARVGERKRWYELPEEIKGGGRQMGHDE